jgi:hypothetical protein
MSMYPHLLPTWTGASPCGPAKAARNLFGSGRTSPALEETIGRAFDALTAEEVTGEGGTGFRLGR